MNPALVQEPDARAGVSADLFAAIAPDLERAEEIFSAALHSPQPAVTRLLDHLAHYRGKRLRPALLLLTARACGNITPAHHVLAAVVEMIHTATLVHDDVLDTATVRRHVPTVNARWGNQASILLGDYLFTHAFHLTSTLDDPRACRLIGEATNRVCAGELSQVCERGNLDLSEDDYFRIIDAKTAELTSCCCMLGALYSGLPAIDVDCLARYGRALGIAFQIADDVLDLVGDEDATGKSLGTDLDQQKLTLPVIHLLNQLSRDEKDRLKSVLMGSGNHKRTKLLPQLEASGALDYARRRAEGHAAQAQSELRCLPASPFKLILDHLPRRVVHRRA